MNQSNIRLKHHGRVLTIHLINNTTFFILHTYIREGIMSFYFSRTSVAVEIYINKNSNLSKL